MYYFVSTRPTLFSNVATFVILFFIELLRMAGVFSRIMSSRTNIMSVIGVGTVATGLLLNQYHVNAGSEVRKLYPPR